MTATGHRKPGAKASESTDTLCGFIILLSEMDRLYEKSASYQ
jgi:hypothetical protein